MKRSLVLWFSTVIAGCPLIVGCTQEAKSVPVSTVSVASVSATHEVPKPPSAPEIAEQPPAPLVDVTPEALEVIQRAASDLPKDDSWVLRIRVSWPANVCSPQHAMDFGANRPTDEDHAFESHGLRFHVLKRQMEMLRGTRITFGRMGDATGLMFDNPNFKGESLETWEPILAADPLSQRP